MSDLSTRVPPAGDEPRMLPLEEARRRMSAKIEPIRATERVDLRASLGRILARDIISPIDVPAHDNSAMDGYAVRASDLRAPGPSSFEEIGRALAGAPFHGEVGPGQCVRIMTGAMMPAAADTVVPQEFASVSERGVSLSGVLEAGQNRRLRGEDLRQGKPALPAGRRIRAPELGLLASLGIGDIEVVRRLRVATLSTGDEIGSLGEPLKAGMVYDSNRFTLYAMLCRLDIEVIDLGVVGDDEEALAAALHRGCREADAIITSGGVSVGEADHTRALLERLGEVVFWKIAMKPGQPLAFGQLTHEGRSVLLFGLPGNPVAAMVTFYALVREALGALAGATPPALPMLTLRCDSALQKRAGRTEFQRGIAYRAEDGWHVRVTGKQGSGILRSMSEANCLIVLPNESGPVPAGDFVEAIPLEGLL